MHLDAPDTVPRSQVKGLAVVAVKAGDRARVNIENAASTEGQQKWTTLNLQLQQRPLTHSLTLWLQARHAPVLPARDTLYI